MSEQKTRLRYVRVRSPRMCVPSGRVPCNQCLLWVQQPDGSPARMLICLRRDCDNHVHDKGGDPIEMANRKPAAGNPGKPVTTKGLVGNGTDLHIPVHCAAVDRSEARCNRTKTTAARLLETAGIRLFAWMLWLAETAAMAFGYRPKTTTKGEQA